MKRFLCIVLSLVIVVSIVPCSIFTAVAGTTVLHGVEVDYGEASVTTVDNGDTVFVFNSADQLVIGSDVVADILVVGGGGSGSSGASSGSTTSKKGYGGKGGEVKYIQSTALSAGKYEIVIGFGGRRVSGTKTSRLIGRAGMASSITAQNSAFEIVAKGGAGGDTAVSGKGTTCAITGALAIYGKDGASKTSSGTSVSGAANTGNGGQGGYASVASGEGGSGVVVVRIKAKSVPHKAVYSVDQLSPDTLVAECAFGADCYLTEPLRLSLNEFGYLDTDELHAWMDEGFEVPTVLYYDASDDEHPLSGDPTEAGDYIAKAIVGSGSNRAVALRSFSLTGHSHTVNGKRVVFEAWTKNSYLPRESGNYYLTNDVNLTNSWSISNGITINLCLNGHSINYIGTAQRSVIKVSKATLNIFDCNDSGTKHYFSPAVESSGKTAQGTWISSTSATDYFVVGGRISGGTGTTVSNCNGGGILIDGGSVNLYGGNIVGNCAISSINAVYGGGVFVKNGQFNMYGGAIIGNSAFVADTDVNKKLASGGGLFIDEGGSANLYGGVITENLAGNYAGGVYGAKGEITVGGDVYIRNNHAYDSDYVAAGDTENNIQTGQELYLKFGEYENLPQTEMNIGFRRHDADFPISVNVNDYSMNIHSDNANLYVKYIASEKIITLGDRNANNVHDITVKNIGNGVLNSSRDAAEEGETVNLLPNPSDGYTIKSISYKPASDNEETVITETNGTYSFVMPNDDVTVTAEFIPVFEFKSKNLALDSALAFRFKGVLNDPTVAADAYVEFTVGDTGNKQIAKLSEAEVDANGRYVLTCYLNALEVNEKIHAVFRYGVDGEKSYTRKNPLSLDDYLDQVMELHAGSNRPDDMAAADLVDAIYNYTYEVQAALDADDDYEDAVSAAYMTELLDSSVLDELRPDVQVQDGYTKTTVSYGLALDDKTAIELFLRAEAGHTPVVKVNGESVDVAVKDATNNIYSVVIPDIMAHQLKKTFTVDVDNGGISISNLSALSYAVSVFDTEELSEYKMALSAMYEYCEKTIAYRDLVMGG